jgi:hypothetical protein
MRPWVGLLMSKSVRSTRRSLVQVSWLAIATTVLAPAATSLAGADKIEPPIFRQGLWNFHRTVERIQHAPGGNAVLQQNRVTRCVNPNLAMSETFASHKVGSCSPSAPQKIDNKYIISNRCDYMGPVRTEIAVESDEAYTEINVLTVGALPRRDVVVARRLGACADNPVETTGSIKPKSP